MPVIVSNLFARFPLIVYPATSPASGAPEQPSLWLLGPPPDSSHESLDPYSRQATALARFLSISVTPRWLTSAVGAPAAQLPSLHLPDGNLLARDEITAHLLGKAQAGTDATSDATHQAYTALVQTKLLPAVLAAVYLAPETASSAAVVPRTSDRPWLSALACAWTTVPNERRARIAEIKRLRGGKEGARIAVDLEALERDASEAIGALEIRARQGEAESRWFGGSQ